MNKLNTRDSDVIPYSFCESSNGNSSLYSGWFSGKGIEQGSVLQNLKLDGGILFQNINLVLINQTIDLTGFLDYKKRLRGSFY